MNDDLRSLVHDRLTSDGLLQKNWSGLVLAACDGRDAVEDLLKGGKAAASPAAATKRKKHAGAYLTSLAVQGFRGIGPKQTLTFTPGPGLTIVLGRNGSGKSSFAEALEVLFTGDSKRWSDRSKIWKEGWRNLHHAHPAVIEADILLEGQGPATIACAWEADGTFEAQSTHVQPKGKRKTSLQELGWCEALVPEPFPRRQTVARPASRVPRPAVLAGVSLNAVQGLNSSLEGWLLLHVRQDVEGFDLGAPSATNKPPRDGVKRSTGR